MEQINILFREMIENLFDVSWITDDELSRICNAAELYAEVRTKRFIKWLTKEDSPYAILYNDGDIRFATIDEDLTINQLYEKYKQSLNNQP
jgi:hypothetical protein